MGGGGGGGFSRFRCEGFKKKDDRRLTGPLPSPAACSLVCKSEGAPPRWPMVVLLWRRTPVLLTTTHGGPHDLQPPSLLAQPWPLPSLPQGFHPPIPNPCSKRHSKAWRNSEGPTRGMRVRIGRYWEGFENGIPTWLQPIPTHMPSLGRGRGHDHVPQGVPCEFGPGGSLAGQGRSLSVLRQAPPRPQHPPKVGPGVGVEGRQSVGLRIR